MSATEEREASLVHAQPAAGAHDRRAMGTVLRIEKGTLAVRYGAAVVLIVALIRGDISQSVNLFTVFLSFLLIQNVWVHALLLAGRQILFLSQPNFLLHLAQVSLAAVLCLDYVPASAAYLVLITGYGVYTRNPSTIQGVSLICTGACLLVIAASRMGEWGWGVYVPALANAFAVAAGGFLVQVLASGPKVVSEAQSLGSELTASVDALHAILDHTAEPILVYGEDGLILLVNESACEFLGVERRHLVGYRFSSYLSHGGFLPGHGRSLGPTEGEPTEVTVLTDRGEKRTAELLVRSFAQGERRVYVGLLHDKTEQREVYEASERARSKLRRIRRQLDHAYELQDALVATITQRLRSPLSAILGYTEMMLSDELGELTEEQRISLENCPQSARRIFSMVDETQGLSPAADRDRAMMDSSADLTPHGS